MLPPKSPVSKLPPELEAEIIASTKRFRGELLAGLGSFSSFVDIEKWVTGYRAEVSTVIEKVWKMKNETPNA